MSWDHLAADRGGTPLPKGVSRTPDGRCEAMMTPSAVGVRCKKAVVPGENRCERHLGLQETRWNNGVMHKFYLEKLRPTLMEAVESAVRDAPVVEQLSLLDEVALVRHASSHSLEMYQDAVDSGKPQTIMLAAELLKSSMLEVAEIVKVAANVEDVKSRVVDSFSHAMGHVITQVMQCLTEVYGDDYRVREFEDKLRARVEIAKVQQQAIGTDLTPDMLDEQVHAIDELVP